MKTEFPKNDETYNPKTFKKIDFTGKFDFTTLNFSWFLNDQTKNIIFHMQVNQNCKK